MVRARTARPLCKGDAASAARLGRLVDGAAFSARRSGGRMEAASQSDQKKSSRSRPRLPGHRALPPAPRYPEKEATDKKIRRDGGRIQPQGRGRRLRTGRGVYLALSKEPFLRRAGFHPGTGTDGSDPDPALKITARPLAEWRGSSRPRSGGNSGTRNTRDGA